MISRKKMIFPYSMLACGSLLAIMAAGLIIIYMFEAVVNSNGQTDLSLLYSFMPMLIAGIVGLPFGFGISMWGLARLRKIRDQNTRFQIQRDRFDHDY